MRLIVYLFGKELLTVTASRDEQPAAAKPEPAAPEPVWGSPFGFSGGAGGHFEHAYEEGGMITQKVPR